MKIRKNARAILLNKNNDIFLFKFHFAMLQGSKTLWVTPGGGVDGDETFEEALKRELNEELGIKDVSIGQWIWYREKLFTTKSGDEMLSEERYYLVKIDNCSITYENMTSVEKKLTKEGKWWSIDSLNLSNEEFFTDLLYKRLQKIINGVYPVEPEEV